MSALLRPALAVPALELTARDCPVCGRQTQMRDTRFYMRRRAGGLEVGTIVLALPHDADCGLPCLMACADPAWRHLNWHTGSDCAACFRQGARA